MSATGTSRDVDRFPATSASPSVGLEQALAALDADDDGSPELGGRRFQCPPDVARGDLQILGEAELAAALTLTIRTLQIWRGKGTGPKFVKLGKQVFYRRRDLSDWIDTCVQVPREEGFVGER